MKLMRRNLRMAIAMVSKLELPTMAAGADNWPGNPSSHSYPGKINADTQAEARDEIKGK